LAKLGQYAGLDSGDFLGSFFHRGGEKWYDDVEGIVMPEPKPKRRWYRLSPERLIIGLFAVEGCLLLSKRFQWFAFNEKKGWTVLIAVAAVCVVVVLMLLWLAASLLFRWRFQFSLRSLVVLVVAVAVPLGWFGMKMREAERQRKAVEAICRVGGWRTYDYQVNESGLPIYEQDGSLAQPPTPAWPRELIGDDFFADVVGVGFHFPLNVNDEVLGHVNRLARLERLKLSHTEVGDEELEHLKGLKCLKYLDLSDTKVTEKRIEELRTALPNCKIQTPEDFEVYPHEPALSFDWAEVEAGPHPPTTPETNLDQP